MRALFVAAVWATAALATASCGSVTSPSDNKTDTFNGTITPVSLGGTGSGPQHSFNVPNSGEYTVKVTSMTPTFNNFVGVYLGNGDNCGLVVDQRSALVGAQAMAGPIYQTGQYCVIVYDLGNMTVKEDYTVVVSHP